MPATTGNSRLPFLHRSLAGRALALVWIVGGLLVVAAVVLPDPPEMSAGATFVVGLALLAGGAAFVALDHLPVWACSLLLLLGVAIISVVAAIFAIGTLAITVALVLMLARAGEKGSAGALTGAVRRSGDASAIRELERAIDQDQFVVVYQPTVSLRTGRVIGFEALVRWQHPERGLLEPSAFIPLAESAGLIEALHRRVLRRACHEARRWNDLSPEHSIGVAVNLSAQQLDDDALLPTVEHMLLESGLPAPLLTLELTETGLAENPDNAAQRLWALRRLGVDLAMDDFGTGYSSLSQLRRLPFSTVKIDRSFVGDMLDAPEAAALVSAMIGIGRGLGRTVIAEGVETVEQLDHLYKHGCDHAQGFLLGRPTPSEHVPRLLSHREDGLGLVRSAQRKTAAQHRL